VVRLLAAAPAVGRAAASYPRGHAAASAWGAAEYPVPRGPARDRDPGCRAGAAGIFAAGGPRRAETAARCAGLDAGEAVAVAEAAVIATALAARRDGQPPRLVGTPGKVTSTLPGNDLRAEAARLILVARAFRCSPIVARIAGRAGGAAEPGGRLES